MGGVGILFSEATWERFASISLYSSSHYIQTGELKLDPQCAQSPSSALRQPVFSGDLLGPGPGGSHCRRRLNYSSASVHFVLLYQTTTGEAICETRTLFPDGSGVFDVGD